MSQHICGAVSGSYRRERRCTAKAAGYFEWTRKRYGNEEGDSPTVTVQLGWMCRRHANQFTGSKQVDPPQVVAR